MNKSINGYKCFKEGLVTRFGDKMELGILYENKTSPQFNQSGYHFCTNLEDTFRYFNTNLYDIDVCEVTGYPEFSVYNDEYYGYYNMYSCKKIVLNKILTRSQIIEQTINMSNHSLKKFLSTFRLTQNELENFMDIFKDNYEIMLYLIGIYYDSTIYFLDYNEKIKILKQYQNYSKTLNLYK